MAEIKTKICTKCKVPKPLSEFYKDVSKVDGLTCVCKLCSHKAAKIYNQGNKEKTSIAGKIYRQKNKEKIKIISKAYYKANKEKIQKQHRAYSKAHLPEAAKRMRKWRERPIVKAKEKVRHKQWAQSHRVEINEYARKWRNDPKNKVSTLISRAIRLSLKGGKGGHHWGELVDFTLKDLIKQLKKTLPEGYTWNDYLNGADLHIDHKVPVHVFNITSYNCSDFKRCWSLNNLQLLPALENRTKSAKIEHSFQPSLTGF